MPEGEHLTPSDASKLLASQNEASRIVRKLERLATSGAGPFKQNPAEVLKGEYERGLEVGGVQGGAICRGVLEAADELGVDKDQVVDAFRKQSHRNALEDAERALMLTQHISRSVPEPPFPNPNLQRVKASGRVGTYGAGGRKQFVPRPEATAEKGRRRPQWK